MFRCVSQWDRDDETAVITLTNFQENKVGQVTRGLRSDQHLMALAMVYTSPTLNPASETSTSDPTPVTTASLSSSTAAPTTSAPSSSDAPLSAGAAAGIGVGAAAGVLIIGLLCAWLFWWRRRPGKPGGQAPAELATAQPFSFDGSSPSTVASPARFQTQTTPSELPSERDPGELHGTTPQFYGSAVTELPDNKWGGLK
ncbi:hypothetical protein UCREL1_5715 [Eutypa lata UCREL1]|uniref:Uncharacterized protein n=1 Tax=Eutypa lata (strain UCR-EL1) TaxID=1287681 RepID=M7SSR5_EUTLA|nr:hypothetical protein UCREL1_5715 [Eutypa lata UCREL1]